MIQPKASISVTSGGNNDTDQDGHHGQPQNGCNEDGAEHQKAVLNDLDTSHVFSNIQRHPDNINK